MSAGHKDDASQFNELVKPHLDRLYRLSFRLTGTVADAEDLLQDVLCKLFERRNELSSISDLGPWMCRVLHNRFIDDVRKHTRQRLQVVADVDDFDTPSPDPQPDAAVETAFDITRLQSALAALSVEHRSVLLMHDSEGYKLEEIQVITGTPVGTLKSRLHRARARLRTLLEADGTFSSRASCKDRMDEDHGLSKRQSATR